MDPNLCVHCKSSGTLGRAETSDEEKSWHPGAGIVLVVCSVCGKYMNGKGMADVDQN